MAARAAVRDAGRPLGVPRSDVDRASKMIPSGPTGLTIGQALEQIPELMTLYRGSPEMRKWLDAANSHEGLARNAGTHPDVVAVYALRDEPTTHAIVMEDSGAEKSMLFNLTARTRPSVVSSGTLKKRPAAWFCITT